MATQDRPVGVGIKAMEIYLPNRYIAQSELEVHDGVSAGKYEIGLGQIKMGYCDDREDIYSFCLTAVSQLLEKYGISPSSIGRLEVGTETLLDKSKSVKSVLMQLFESSGNTDIEGVDTINACYGGTNALFNAINWVQSDSWDGRDAIVVTGDIAIYDRGPARPTGGAGAVAMLIGPNAPLVIEPGRRGSYMQHTYDFFKPNMSSEYPVVDGQYSIECYFRALDGCYKAYTTRSKRVEDRKAAVTNGSASKGHRPNGVHQNGNTNGSSKEATQSQRNGHTNGQTNGHSNGYTNGNTNGYTNGHTNGHSNGNTSNAIEEIAVSDSTEFENFDYMCFHTPNTKLAQKSYARLQYNDYVRNPLSTKYKDIPASIREITAEKSLSDKSIEKAFMAHTADLYKKRSLPSTLAASMCGNMYTASVYGALASLICNVSQDDLAGKRIAMFSYGSGLASTMFSFRVSGDVSEMHGVLNLNARLKARIHKSPAEYEKALYLREVAYSRAGLTPYGDVSELVKGTYYLENVDEKFRRFYKIKE